MVSIEFLTDSTAFDDNPVLEFMAVLNRISRAFDAGVRSGKIRDSNGIEIGYWESEACARAMKEDGE